MLTTILILASGLPFGTAAASAPTPMSVVAPAEETFATLVVEYDAALQTWRDQLNAAETSKERKALRDSNPALAFWPRFQKLADAGDGESLLWQVEHLRDTGVKSKERGERLRPLYDKLVEHHADAAWFVKVPDQLYRQRRYVGDEEAHALLVRIDKGSENIDVRATAVMTLATLTAKIGGEGSEAKVEALYDRLEKEFGETEAGMKARAKRMRGQTEVGKVAPDFVGKTIDGFEFKLSEYRGKVVMLDFYGFW